LIGAVRALPQTVRRLLGAAGDLPGKVDHAVS
jgi:hypothetical protein